MSAGDSLHDALRRVTAGRYWIERELARGGMGAVFLARDIALERVVAIKVLLPDVATPQVRERFLREARTAAGLSHPHIVAVHAVEAHDALAFFVMAHIDGETLRERVTRAGPLTPAEAIRLMQEVAWALGHAHERGIVHRDVKPDNLILERSTGRALVTDFGIAALVDGDVLARSGEILGTPHFISPEQARGETVDGRSDLYSLGATVFFALSGRPPFEAPGAAGLLAKHVAEPAPSIGSVCDDLPPHLVTLVDACLAKDPGERPASGEWLARELEAARQVAPAVAPALVRIADETDRLAYEGAGYAGLAAVGLWVAGADGIFGMFEAIAGWTAVMVSTGLAGARAIQFGADVRRLTRAGFAESEIRRAIAQPRRDDTGAQSERRRRIKWGALLASGGLLVGYWAGGRDYLTALTGATWLEWPAIVAPFVVLRAGIKDLLTHPGRVQGAWRRLWSGRFGRRVMRALTVGQQGSRAVPVRAEPTEVLLRDAIGEEFEALPAGLRRELRELPRLAAQLEAHAAELRERKRELDAALAPRGGRLAVPDPADASHEGAPRSIGAGGSRRDLGSLRANVESRLASVVTMLEHLRLQLMRLRSGVSAPGDVTRDLNRAQEIGEEIDALLRGSVEEAAAEPERTPV